MIRGTAHVFGHHLNTDAIHPPQYFSLNPERVRQGLMMGVDPLFLERFVPGDILVAGENFGCGSSRETSIYSMLYNKVGAIVAVSFARIFFRSAVNNGLQLFEFENAAEYEKMPGGCCVTIDDVRDTLLYDSQCVPLRSVPSNIKVWFDSKLRLKTEHIT